MDMEMQVFSKAGLSLILSSLKAIPEMVAAGDDTCGICSTLDKALRVSGNNHLRSNKWLLQYLFAAWPKYSGDIDYPVPSPYSGVDEETVYIRAKTLWEGHYGDLRRELLQFMIEELEKEIDSV